MSGSAPDAVVSSAVVISVSATGAPFLPECVESAVAIGWLGCVACRLSVPCPGLAVWAEIAGIVWVVPGPMVRARLSRAKPAGIPAVGCWAAGDGTVGSDAAWSGCAAASMCSAACAVSADSAFSAASASSLYAATRSEKDCGIAAGRFAAPHIATAASMRSVRKAGMSCCRAMSNFMIVARLWGKSSENAGILCNFVV